LVTVVPSSLHMQHDTKGAPPESTRKGRVRTAGVRPRSVGGFSPSLHGPLRPARVPLSDVKGLRVRRAFARRTGASERAFASRVPWVARNPCRWCRGGHRLASNRWHPVGLLHGAISTTCRRSRFLAVLRMAWVCMSWLPTDEMHPDNCASGRLLAGRCNLFESNVLCERSSSVCALVLPTAAAMRATGSQEAPTPDAEPCNNLRL